MERNRKIKTTVGQKNANTLLWRVYVFLLQLVPRCCSCTECASTKYSSFPLLIFFETLIHVEALVDYCMRESVLSNTCEFIAVTYVIVHSFAFCFLFLLCFHVFVYYCTYSFIFFYLYYFIFFYGRFFFFISIISFLFLFLLFTTSFSFSQQLYIFCLVSPLFVSAFLPF